MKVRCSSRSQEGGIRYGVVTLTVQLYIQGIRVLWQPTLRPGERLPPSPPKTAELIVDLAYPADSGMQERLAAMGFKIGWCRESRLTRAINIDGCEIVQERGRDGTLISFRMKDRPEDQILIKKRM